MSSSKEYQQAENIEDYTIFQRSHGLDDTVLFEYGSGHEKPAIIEGMPITLGSELDKYSKPFPLHEGATLIQNSPVTITVEDTRQITYFDLSEVFPAADIMASMGFLTFEIVNQQDMQIAQAAINEIFLELECLKEAKGEINFIVRGTYLDGSVYDTPFRIEIAPSADTCFHSPLSEEIKNPWFPEPLKAFDSEKEEELIVARVSESNVVEDTQSIDPELPERPVREILGIFEQRPIEYGLWSKLIQLNF